MSTMRRIMVGIGHPFFFLWPPLDPFPFVFRFAKARYIRPCTARHILQHYDKSLKRIHCFLKRTVNFGEEWLSIGCQCWQKLVPNVIVSGLTSQFLPTSFLTHLL